MNKKVKDAQSYEKIVLNKDEAVNYMQVYGELCIDGKFYDIGEQVTEGNNIVFYCVSDEDDSSLFSNLAIFLELQDNMKDIDDNLENQLMSSLSIIFVVPQLENSIKNEVLITYIKDIPQSILSINLPPDNLPPRQV